jgi:alkanesulfonate monooxygenase SsuD/methylene tetrahydromethanopterin reductase-like flavin-dependent oxidoreductase (luciferase family)
VNYGFILYTGGDIHTLPALAAEAEETGWDGVFYWDGIYLDRHAEAGDHVYDPWVVLAAFAMRTERVRIGALLTPLPRRRPWKVARESVSVDHLSRGRLVLPVGMGFVPDAGFSRVGERSDARTRAERLDESLEIICGLWTGRPFAFRGNHYAVEEMTFPTAAGAGPPHTDPGAGSLAPCHPV